MRFRPLVRHLPALSAALALLPLAIGASAQEMPRPPRPPHLTVTGRGEVSFRPDMAEITIGVVTENRSSQTAASENARVSQQVQDAVRKLGIADRDIQTINYSVQPVYNHQQNRPPVLTGYRVYNQVRIKVREMGKIGDVIDAATAAGSNTIENIQFSSSKPDQYEGEALEKAVQEARRKAQRIARAAGQTLTRILEINENSGFRPVPMYMAARGAAAEANTPINPGELTATASVTVTYGISGELREARVERKAQTLRATLRNRAQAR